MIGLLLLFFSSVDSRLPLPSEVIKHTLDFGRVGILSFATPDVWSYARYSVPLWNLYADLHQYEFFFQPLNMNRTRHGTLRSLTRATSRNRCYVACAPDVWTKVLAVEKYLPLVDYILFAEADTYPVNNRISGLFPFCALSRMMN